MRILCTTNILYGIWQLFLNEAAWAIKMQVECAIYTLIVRLFSNIFIKNLIFLSTKKVTWFFLIIRPKILFDFTLFSAGAPTVVISPASVNEFSSYIIHCTFPGDDVTSVQIIRLDTPVVVFDYNASVSTNGSLHPDWQVIYHWCRPRGRATPGQILWTYGLVSCWSKPWPRSCSWQPHWQFFGITIKLKARQLLLK